jgi:DNA polymerase-3 subunit gamma/tau
MSEIEPLITRYRPDDFDGVIGQPDVVKALRLTLSKGDSRAFLFYGPAGTGKTTLARIVAKHVGADRLNVREVDAAKYNGVDDMRELTSMLGLSALGKSPARVLIVDEAHAISKAAWQSLLKSIEEPPPHVYWMFCTTELAKVPKTIQTRCQTYGLKPVDPEVLHKFIRGVAKAEGMTVDPEVLEAVAYEAQGSPRRALSALGQCAGLDSADAVRRMMGKMGEPDDEMIEFCRTLVSGQVSWVKLSAKVMKLPSDQDPETVRRVVFDYITKACADTTAPDKAAGLLNVLEAFAQPYPPDAAKGHLLLSVGRVCFATE